MKTLFKHLSIQIFILLSIGVGYAAWNTLVTDGETLTATKWNDIVNQLSGFNADLSNLTFSGGNIGIGTNTPSALFHVNGTTIVNGISTFSDQLILNRQDDALTRFHMQFRRGGLSAAFLGTTGNGASGLTALNFGLNQNNYLNILDNGNIGIGTLSPSALLSVNGTANKPGGGSWAVFSDARSKESIENYSKGLKELTQLRPVMFEYKKEMGWGDNKVVGLVAQEVEEVIPTMVSDIGDIQGIQNFKQVDPNELTYMLINAVKELEAKIEILENK